MYSLLLPVIASLAQRAAAHGLVTKIVVGTSTYQGYDPNFQYMTAPPPTIGWAAPATQDRGPVDGNKLADPDIICQRNATPATTAAQVAAGDMVALQWSPWPSSHHGPMLDYLAACPGDDCSSIDKTTLKFFKIDGVGMVSTDTNPPTFGDDTMIAQDNTWMVQIPSNIKAGAYVLRHETIALHQAQAAGGAQPYPQCVNIMVTGDGTDEPEGVLGTELYKADDPGIKFNIYQQFDSTDAYTVPGPPLYSGAANGASAAASAMSTMAPFPANSTATMTSGMAMPTDAPGDDCSDELPGGSAISNVAEIGEIGNQDNAQGLIATPEEAYENAKARREAARMRLRYRN